MHLAVKRLGAAGAGEGMLHEIPLTPPHYFSHRSIPGTLRHPVTDRWQQCLSGNLMSNEGAPTGRSIHDLIMQFDCYCVRKQQRELPVFLLVLHTEKMLARENLKWKTAE